jgi:hypothetical protein
MQTAGPPELAPLSRPQPPRRRRWLWLVLGFAAFFVLAPVLAYFYFRWSTDRAIGALLAEIEAADPRWRMEQVLADRPPLPDDQNAGLVVENVHALLGRGGFSLGSKQNEELFDDYPPEARLNDAQRVVLRGVLTKHAKAVAEARRIKDLPRGRYAIDYSGNMLTVSLEPLQRSRTVVSLLQHDAMLRADDGKDAEAVDACRAMLNTGRAAGEEPFLISVLVRYAEEALAVYTLERVLAQGQPPDEALRAMQEALEMDATDEPLVWALRTERAGLHWIVEDLKHGTIPASQLISNGRPAATPADAFADTFLPLLLLRDEIELYRLMNRNVESAKLPTEKQAEAFRAVDDEIRASRRSPLVSLLMPATQKVSEAHRRTQAVIRAALVAVAAERYRLTHDRWPDSADALVKAGLLARVPADPFDGRPARLKRTPEGLVLYCVSFDGLDNGGVIERRNPLTPGTDLGFRLWDVSLRRQPPRPPAPRNDGE